MPQPLPDEMRAVARLPGIDIDILHRAGEDRQSEEMLIRVRATPSFEAALGSFQAANPFLLWSRMVQTAWVPWLGMMGLARNGQGRIGQR